MNLQNYIKCKEKYSKKSFIVEFIFSNLILFLYCFLNLGCVPKPPNPTERNIINFATSVKEMEDSLKYFEILLKKFSLKNDEYYRYELLDSNHIQIFNSTININSIINYPEKININEFKSFSKEEIVRFLKVIIFLNKNYITGCDFWISENIFLFDYRNYNYIKKLNSDYRYDLRRIIYYSSKNNEYDEDFFKELDKKGHLYLLTHKGSDVW